jgi:membrane protein YqaA with SNARE-associated domain
MKLFGPMYERTLQWARHRNATWLLAFLSFIEAIFFPIPPEVMLAPMCLSQPRRAFWFATVSLAAAVAGAMIGYYLGHYAWQAVQPLLGKLGMLHAIEEGIELVREKSAHSPWAVFWFLVLAGFSPIPMKVFTWASGIVGVPMLPFMLSMLVGRGKRLYLVAAAIRIGGERAERALHRYIEPIGWAVLMVLVALVGWLLLRSHGA